MIINKFFKNIFYSYDSEIEKIINYNFKNKHYLSDKIDQNILENKIVNKSASLLSKNKSHEISKMLNAPSESKVASLVDCLVS